MKKIFLIFTSMACLLFASLVYAEEEESSNPFHAPYMGLEVAQTNMHCKDFYGKNVFGKNPISFDFFGGIKWHENFGVEAGFGFQTNRRKSERVNEWDSHSGEIIEFSRYEVHRTKLKAKHIYMGLFAEHQFFGFEDIKVKGLLGYSSTTVYGIQEVIEDDGMVFTAELIERFAHTYRQKKTILMAKLYASYAITDNIDLGVVATWKDYSKFKIKNREQNTAADREEIRLRDVYSIGVRLAYNFV